MDGLTLAGANPTNRISRSRRRRTLRVGGDYDRACRRDRGRDHCGPLDHFVELSRRGALWLRECVPPGLPILRMPAVSAAVPQKLPNAGPSLCYSANWPLAEPDHARSHGSITRITPD